MYADHTFDKLAEIRDYVGGGWGNEDTYMVSKVARCRIRPISGNERFTGGKTTVIATHRIYMGVQEITVRDRLWIDDIEYEIVLVSRPSESEHLEIDALRIE